MPLVSTEAIVLHAFDYSETSRILRLATRDAGVQSVLARGARRHRNRFGTALDLFAGGTAHLLVKEGRELQTLTAFDVTRPRAEIAASLARFAGASAVTELVLRFGRADDAHPGLFDTLEHALDDVAAADADTAAGAALAGAWQLVSEMGFSPALHACADCHAPLGDAEAFRFDHSAGGLLCAACGARRGGGRVLPARARQAIAVWIEGAAVLASGAGGSQRSLRAGEIGAHQRLLREFLQAHLADGRALRAFEAWEHGGWSAP